MKYEELLELARRQDVPEDVGPPVETVLEQVAATPAPSGGIAAGAKAWGWGAALVGLVVVGVFAVGPGRAPGSAAPREAHPVAQGVEVARPLPAGSPEQVAPAEPAAVPPSATDATPPATAAAAVEPDSEDASGDARGRSRGQRGKRRSPAPSPEDLYREIEAHLAAGERSAARRKLVRLVARYPRWKGHATAMIDLAHLEEQTGDVGAAYCTYRRFLERHGADVLAAEARRALDRLTARFPEGPPDCG